MKCKHCGMPFLDAIRYQRHEYDCELRAEKKLQAAWKAQREPIL